MRAEKAVSFVSLSAQNMQPGLNTPQGEKENYGMNLGPRVLSRGNSDVGTLSTMRCGNVCNMNSLSQSQGVP